VAAVGFGGEQQGETPAFWLVGLGLAHGPRPRASSLQFRFLLTFSERSVGQELLNTHRQLWRLIRGHPRSAVVKVIHGSLAWSLALVLALAPCSGRSPGDEGGTSRRHRTLPAPLAALQ